jgi:hypothetical protein
MLRNERREQTVSCDILQSPYYVKPTEDENGKDRMNVIFNHLKHEFYVNN